MAKDDPGRQPFVGTCTANSTAVETGYGEIDPVPSKKRLVVESVSAAVTTSTPGSLYGIGLNGPFSLFMIPKLISDGPFDLRVYYSTHAIRFYVESGGSIQFAVSTTGVGGEGTCYISGYFPDT